jgi:hypothetical protein
MPDPDDTAPLSWLQAARPPTVKALFEMSNEELIKAWRRARIDDIITRYGDCESGAHEMRKLGIEVIRLVISFRLMGREFAKLPEES